MPATTDSRGQDTTAAVSAGSPPRPAPPI